MGFFANDRPAKDAVLGQAQVLGMQASGSQRQFGGGIPEQKLYFTLQIRVDGWPPYQAQAEHFVPLTVIPQLSSGPAFLAVWVDPQHPENVVLDLTIGAPTVTSAPTPGQPTAADLLATGVPAEAVIQQFSPLPMRNQLGYEMFAFSLVVMPPGFAPYMVQVGNPVPPPAYQLLFPGSRVPVKLGPTQQEVAIDWDGALGGAAQVNLHKS